MSLLLKKEKPERETTRFPDLCYFLPVPEKQTLFEIEGIRFFLSTKSQLGQAELPIGPKEVRIDDWDNSREGVLLSIITDWCSHTYEGWKTFLKERIWEKIPSEFRPQVRTLHLAGSLRLYEPKEGWNGEQVTVFVTGDLSPQERGDVLYKRMKRVNIGLIHPLVQEVSLQSGRIHIFIGTSLSQERLIEVNSILISLCQDLGATLSDFMIHSIPKETGYIL